MPRIPTHVHSDDPVYEAGVAGCLRGRPEVQLVTGTDQASVTVVIVDEVDDAAVQTLRRFRRSGVERVVVVAAALDENAVLAAAEAGVYGLIRRSDAATAKLVDAITAAAAGDGTMPADLLGRLLEQVGRIQREILAPGGMTLAGLTEREIEVLRLVADGCDTVEIAHQLCYSERTIKNVIQGVTARLHLRNRSHAVAYALRAGLI